MSNILNGTVPNTENVKGSLNAVYGKDGKSAYELAVTNGFEGTETEWLESLVGKSGVYVGSGDMPDGYNVQIDPDGIVNYDAVVKKYVDEVVDKLSLKGTTQGKGSLSLPDVSPIPHTAKITVKNFDGYIQIGENKAKSATGRMAEWCDGIVLEPNKTYTFSWDDPTSVFDGQATIAFYALDWEKEGATTFYYDVPKVTETGRLYATFSTGVYSGGLSYSPPSDPTEIKVENVCLVEGTGTEYIPYEETEIFPEFTPMNITVVNEDEIKTIEFTEPTTKAVEISAKSGIVTITADNPDANIEVEYNRDIIKAITALENAVGLVNTTLASVVDVEE